MIMESAYFRKLIDARATHLAARDVTASHHRREKSPRKHRQYRRKDLDSPHNNLFARNKLCNNIWTFARINPLYNDL